MSESPFWQRGLDVLQQISNKPIAPVDELKLLQRQLDFAIAMVERGDIVPMSEQDRIEHASRFGVGAFVIGDFVITRNRAVACIDHHLEAERVIKKSLTNPS